MAFTYGFYNSKGGDRKYNADQMGNLFDGILNDGVFDNVGNIFATVPGEGLQVLVKSGRAWFNKTWSYNDAAYPIYLERPDVAVPRIDAIVLEVDRRETHRRNRIGYISGIPDSTPKKPTLTNTDLIHQYPLAYVTVRAGTESITHSDIEIRVGQSDCPFVTGILQTANIDDLFAAWNEQFTTWFEGVKSQLEGDVAANLLKEIQLRVPIADKSTKAVSETLKDDTKWMTPLQTSYAVEKKLSEGNVYVDGVKTKLTRGFLYRLVKNKIANKFSSFSFCILPNRKWMACYHGSVVSLYDITSSKFTRLSEVSLNRTVSDFFVSDTSIVTFQNNGSSFSYSFIKINGIGTMNVQTQDVVPKSGYDSAYPPKTPCITPWKSSVVNPTYIIVLLGYTNYYPLSINLFDGSYKLGSEMISYYVDQVMVPQYYSGDWYVAAYNRNDSTPQTTIYRINNNAIYTAVKTLNTTYKYTKLLFVDPTTGYAYIAYGQDSTENANFLLIYSLRSNSIVKETSISVPHIALGTLSVKISKGYTISDAVYTSKYVIHLSDNVLSSLTPDASKEQGAIEYVNFPPALIKTPNKALTVYPEDRNGVLNLYGIGIPQESTNYPNIIIDSSNFYWVEKYILIAREY